MLDTLLRSLYSALDRSPNKQVALRVRHPDGFKWSIRRRTLTAETNAGQRLGETPLIDITIQQLASWLTARGCTVPHVEPAFSGLSAAVLLSGSSDESRTNGDILFAYDSMLWTIMDAYAIEIEEQQLQVDEAIKELYLKTASGDWLDYWGEHFGIAHGPYADYEDYRAYIIEEVLRLRSNPLAIENSIERITGKKVEIYEPWRDLFFLSESQLNNQHTYDGERWGPHLFRPISREKANIKWDDVLPVADKSRPAGVLILDPVWSPPTTSIHIGIGGVGLAQRQANTQRCEYDDKIYLDNFVLGDAPVLNYRIQLFDLFTKISAEGITGIKTGLNSRRNFIRSMIVLSDMDDPMGHENFRFAGTPRVR